MWDVRPWLWAEHSGHTRGVILILAVLLAGALLAIVALTAGYVVVAARWKARPMRPTRPLAPLPDPIETERWTALDDQQLARFITGP